jgi:Tol biopolymer transport system component
MPNKLHILIIDLLIVSLLITFCMLFSSCTDVIKKPTHIYGEVYEWVDAPLDARSWVFVNTNSQLTDEEYYKTKKQDKILKPLEGVKISFRHFSNYGGPPKQILNLSSSENSTFDSGDILLDNPDIIEVSKDGYYDMSLETKYLDTKPILVIMVRSEISPVIKTTPRYNIMFETYLLDKQEHRIYCLKENGDLNLITVGVEPSLSPDGKCIAYLGHSSGPIPPNVNKIYLINVDGSHDTRITKDNISGSGPEWSPDGKRIALLGRETGANTTDLYTINRDGSNLRHLTEYADIQAFSWSPDGTKIAYSSITKFGIQIYLMNEDGSNAKQVSMNPASMDRFSFDINVAWSPDGSKVAYSSGGNSSGRCTIYLANAEGDNQITVFQNDLRCHGFSWSPDSSKIAFISCTGNDPRTSLSDLYIVDIDGSNLSSLYHANTLFSSPNWSFDGKEIIFVSYSASGSGDIYAIKSDGSSRKQLVTNLGVCENPKCVIVSPE